MSACLELWLIPWFNLYPETRNHNVWCTGDGLRCQLTGNNFRNKKNLHTFMYRFLCWLASGKVCQIYCVEGSTSQAVSRQSSLQDIQYEAMSFVIWSFTWVVVVPAGVINWNSSANRVSVIHVVITFWPFKVMWIIHVWIVVKPVPVSWLSVTSSLCSTGCKSRNSNCSNQSH